MNKLYFVILTIVIAISEQFVSGQDLKFGHINSSELIQSMPEFDSAQVKLGKFRQELIKHLELMSVELNNKYDVYMKESKNLNEIIKQTKEQELSDLNRRIQEFQTTAQNQLQEKQAEYFQSIYTKVDNAIKDVGKENGYFYIFDVSQGTLLYFNESTSTNVTTLVRAKLKIK